MFLQCILTALFISSVAAESTKPSTFLLESSKRLEALVKKKEKNIKDSFTVGETFDDFADAAMKLLEELDKQSTDDPNSENKQEIIKMIGSYMAAMEKLLSLMNSPEPEPLKNYCERTSDDPNWVKICNRPAKSISQREIRELREQRLDEERDTRAAKRRKMNDDPDLFPIEEKP